MASFVAMGGNLERGCFNATISPGYRPAGPRHSAQPGHGRPAGTGGRHDAPGPATLAADLRDIQIP